MIILPKKKNYILLFLIIFISIITFSTQANASEYEFDFAKRFGGTSADIGTSITVDADGNKYITGSFSGTVDFGGGNVASAGISDIFVLKLDEDGEFVWVETFGGAGVEAYGKGIVTDVNGSLYITGFIWGTVDFGGGGVVPVDLQDIFVLKLDEDGEFVWVESFGSTDDFYSENLGTSIDTFGNVYITSNFAGTVDFDGHSLVSTSLSSDIFALKINSSGNVIWAKKFGGINVDAGNSILIDNNNNSYITGTFKSSVDFGGGNVSSVGGGDIFVLKLDEDGEFVWVETFGGTSSFVDIGTSITQDDDYIYVTGNARYINFNVTIENINTSDYINFITKISKSTGEVEWIKGIENPETFLFPYVSIDSFGNVYTTGSFSDTVDFDPSSSTSNLTSAGDTDIFILKLNEDGEFVSVETFGGTGTDSVYNLILDEEDNIYTTGSFSNTVDFDPSSSTFNLTSAGNQDIFLLKLSPILIAPTVTTTSSSPVVTSSSLTANITDIGTSSVTNRGFEYGTSLSYGSTISETGTYSTGSYSLNITNLTCNTSYHYRPFATNATGTSYGTDATFTTSACPVNGAVSLAFLISMNQQNQLNNPQAPIEPQTPTEPQPLTNCNSGDIFSNTTGERCNTPLPPFNTNLSLNSNNQDILKLQQFLNKNNYTLAQTGPGSPNNETNFFGPLTRNALIRFQQRNNITPAIGYFGPITRARVNEMLGN